MNTTEPAMSKAKEGYTAQQPPEPPRIEELDIPLKHIKHLRHRDMGGSPTDHHRASRQDRSPVVCDVTDLVFFAAVAMLPIDGTVLGIYAPFWTPISPWLFALHALLNWRDIPSALRRFRAFAVLPVILIVLSAPGWMTHGIHGKAMLMSVFGVLGALACLISLDIAIRLKRIPWQNAIRVAVAVYWLAFAVGVVQWLTIRFDVAFVRTYFERLLARQYISSSSVWGGGRPQFLFAEPSYIGMHLFGVLLPLYWLSRNRNETRLAASLRNVIVVFAAGSLLMGSGTRIVLDSIIALAVVIIEGTRWRNPRQRGWGVVKLLCTAVVGSFGIAMDSRLTSILMNGAEGDGSFFARIYQSLGALIGLAKHPTDLLLGFGAGNIIEATHAGADSAVRLLNSLGLNGGAAGGWYSKMNANTIWTMSAYTSFIAEYGLIGFALLVGLILWVVCRNHAWHKTVVCWLLLVAYLYIQFEGYAFYAIPLFIWTIDYGLFSSRSSD